jgi:hypothetical protein
VYGRTRRGASDAPKVALRDADTGVKPGSQEFKVGTYLDARLTTVKDARRPRTHASYADTVDRYIRPSLGNVVLTKLQPDHV